MREHSKLGSLQGLRVVHKGLGTMSRIWRFINKKILKRSAKDSKMKFVLQKLILDIL